MIVDQSQVIKAKKKEKNQVPSQISSHTVVLAIALTMRPLSSNRTCQVRTTRTDRLHHTHDRASLQKPPLCVFRLGTVVCLIGTTVCDS